MLKPAELSLTVDDVVVTTGSQQLLYLLGELLLDPGDIVITEAPSYFVYQGTLNSLGARTRAALSLPAGPGSLGDQVEMVGHEAPAVNLPVRLLARFVERVHENPPIVVINENGFATIPAIHQVIHRPWILDSEFACHSFSSTLEILLWRSGKLEIINKPF